jgi:peptide/nickel transport system ATP-binding protein
MKAGEILGLAGKSGCGKTVFCSTLLGILEPPGRIESGHLSFTPSRGSGENERDKAAVDLRTLTEKAWRQIRGKHIGMVFQYPRSALNPVYSASTQKKSIQNLWLMCRSLGLCSPLGVLTVRAQGIGGV